MIRQGGVSRKVVVYQLVVRTFSNITETRAGALLLGLVACGGAPAHVAPVAARTTLAPPRDSRPTMMCSRDAAARPPSLGAVAIRGSAQDASSCTPLRSRAGAPVDEAKVDADVRALFATGMFEDVVVAVEEPDSGAATLVFEVKERPRVVVVGVRGLPSDLDAGATLGEKPARYDPVWVRATAARLLEALREGGYRKATVGHEVTPAGDGAMYVLLVVEPGKRFVLGRVRIEGLGAAPEGLVRKGLRLTPGEPVYDELIERDRLVAGLALYEVGLVESDVTTRIEENFLASKLDVVLTVREGPVYKLGTCKVVGPAAFPLAKYREVVAQLPRGAVFARSKVAAAIKEVEALHRATGTERRVEVSTNFDKVKRTIDVELRVE